MILAVALEDVIDDFISVFPGEVNVKIRRRGTIWIEETLEIQIELYGIDIRYLQAISDDRVSAAATTYVKESTIPGIAKYIPGNEKVGIEFKVIDDL